ncbi:Hypothetical predicted protein [Paramuricea clavata]|uniref:Uncharacterized protein n=1 Tax=Paramuricea clavata TaxID=317549 RepID=A0A6S7HZ38_PARCT|nr:Hypothetical predicted protein [Paramuricea clavata]
MAELLDSMRIQRPLQCSLMLAGTDCAWIVEEFEAVYDPPPSSTAHHEERHSLQVKFCKDVLSFVDVLRPDADMIDFFRFENQREPSRLADQGSLRAGTKSDVLECLNAPTGCVSAATHATVVVLDMAAVILMVRSTTAKTFNKYVSLNIIPFLEAQMKNTTQRIDAVWDNYPEENNLKALTQQRRGNGPRTRVGDGSTPIPKRRLTWTESFC